MGVGRHLRAAAEGALVVAALELVSMLATPGDALAIEHPGWFLGLTYGGMLGGIVSVVRLRRGAGSPVARLGWEAAGWLVGALVTLAVATLAAWLAIQVRPAVGDALPTTTSVGHPPRWPHSSSARSRQPATCSATSWHGRSWGSAALGPAAPDPHRVGAHPRAAGRQRAAGGLLSIVLLTTLTLGGWSPFPPDTADAAITDPVSTLC